MEKLDEEILGNLRETLEGAFTTLLDELKGVFYETTENSFQAIQAGITHKDRDVVNREAHSIKGAALTLGSTDFAKSAKALEYEAKTEDWDQLEIRFSEMKDRYEPFKEALEQVK